MADKDLDLSKLDLEDLVHIQNQVLRQVAARAKVNLGNLESAHNSHSSNHSNYSRTALLDQVQAVTKREG
ncbi:MAG: hypothetical protein A4S14_09985 [Proteobacteria bacterium SG_bin9]|nr:MAG: hypothetical protein A4S14_09985 [Proteobacteria bacterium SG_bin9]